MIIKNSKTLPLVYYGLHMAEGCAEYSEPGVKPYRIFVGEDVIKNMNPSFQGKPVYVDHVDEVDVDNLRETADGYVIESFYNQLDGKHWVKFIAVSERAKEAIKMGWKLSNAYVPSAFAGGGLWHGIEYEKEVTGGEYEHLAIVRNPRYEESVILTPEQYKQYNGEKEVEIARLSNSKEKKKMGLKAEKRTYKVENSIELDGLVVTLPLSMKEMSVEKICNEYDKILNMHGYANGDHMVKMGDEEMSVNDLVKKHMEMCNKMKAEDETEIDREVENDDDEAGSIDAGLKDVGDRGGDPSLMNEDEVEEPDQGEEEKRAKKAAIDKKKNSADVIRIREKNAKIRNAGRKGLVENGGEEVARVELASEMVARGKARYGSI